MTTVQIDFKANEVYAYLRDVPQGVKRAASRAMNSMRAPIIDDATDRIIGIYNMRRATVKRGIKMVRRSGPNSLYVVWQARGRAIALKEFGARVVGGRRGKGARRNAPVEVEVIKGSRKISRKGFIGPNGHVFQRVGAARLPIAKRFGPGIQTGFVREQVIRSMERLALTVLPGRIESEMVRELRRLETGRLPGR